VALNRWALPIAGEYARRNGLKRFYNLRASEEVCPKHRNSRRETAGWGRIDHQEVFVLLSLSEFRQALIEMARAGSAMTLPALYFRSWRTAAIPSGQRRRRDIYVVKERPLNQAPYGATYLFSPEPRLCRTYGALIQISGFYIYTAPTALRNRPQVRFQPEQPILLWKAGRYKLAAPVSKTGSASPRSEHCRRLPPLF
jgi:hypothetical protein